MNASAQDAEREVEASRARLDETVDALKEKLTPGQVFDEMSRSFAGSSGGELFSNLGSQIRTNPLPLALIGAGVALLAMKSPATSWSGDPTRIADETGQSGLADGLAHAASIGKDKVQDAAERVGDVTSALAGKVGHALGQAGEGARSGAGAAADTLSQYGHKASSGFQDLLQREPLIVAAFGLAVGAAIGAALPPSALEDKVLGSVRDGVVERGQDIAAEGMAAVKAAADDVAVGVTNILKSDEGDDRSLGEKVGQAAQAAVEAVGQRLDESKRH